MLTITTYIIRRVLQAILVVVLVSLLVFMIVRILPGDPIEMIISSNMTADITPEYVEQLRHEKGLDKPLIVQYVNWIKDILHGNLGVSLMQNYNIADEINVRLKTTLIIGGVAFLVGLVIGVLLGVISAIRRGTWIDNFVTVFANIGITAPAFWVAIVLVYVFVLKLKAFPLYGFTLPWENFSQSLKDGFIPIFVTALSPIATTARQTRSSVLEVLNEDYVRTAWAKGNNERRVVIKHVIKNSLMPIITLQGTMIRMVFGGSVVVEKIFVIPGMGKMMVDGMLSHDYTVIQATTLMMTIIVVIANLIVDLMYAWIDPRIQYS